jgi:hypothetical protein
MEPFTMPKIVPLKGRDAVTALSEFIEELQRQRGQALTDKQIDVLIRIASELISNIEAQTKMDAVVPQRARLAPADSLKRTVGPLTKVYLC